MDDIETYGNDQNMKFLNFNELVASGEHMYRLL